MHRLGRSPSRLGTNTVLHTREEMTYLQVEFGYLVRKGLRMTTMMPLGAYWRLLI
jgi:hypothetical protein